MSRYIKLFYDNNTQVTIEGNDEEVIKILRSLKGEYKGIEIKEAIDIKKGYWDADGLRKVLLNE